MRHIVPISGKDSLATALVVRDLVQPEGTIEYFYNDVGADIPDVHNWLDRVERELLKAPIVRVGESLEDIILDQGILPSFRSRFCTRMAKIYPMEDYLGSEPATVYFGIRADENREGYRPTKKNITPAYPLQIHGIGMKEVYSIIKGYEPPTFYWKRLYD